MRRILLLAAAALLFGLAPLASRLDPVSGALLLVGLAVLLALAASGAASALAIAGGALGAFAFGILAPHTAAVAGAALVGLCFAERTSRVRSRGARRLHALAAIAAGAVAAPLAGGFSTATPALRAVAVIVAAVLVALPLLIDADDPVAHALEAAASDLTGAVAASLASGAELRRTVDEDLLDRKMTAPVRQTWISLLKLAEARTRLARSRPASSPTGAGESALRSPALAVVERLDARIADHVAVLTRAFTAVSTAKAAEISIDDAALRGVEMAGESLEHVSQAMVDEG
jgi:MFS family permease